MRNNNVKLYNRIVFNRDLSVFDDYLNDLIIVKKDFRDLINEYKDKENVFFICDSPYVSTIKDAYSDLFFRMKDFLELLFLLDNANKDFIMFGNEKSEMSEVIDLLKNYNINMNFITKGKYIYKKTNNINKYASIFAQKTKIYYLK